MIASQNYGVAGGSLAASSDSGGSLAARATQGREFRFIMSLVPAAAVTLGLFVTMTQLIRTDEVVLVEKPQRVLSKVTPEHVEAEPIRSIREHAPPVEVLLPPLPPVSKTASKVEGTPVPVFEAQDWGLTHETIRIQPPAPQPVGERIAQAIRPPVASYPRDMATKGQEGTCDVHFSLSTRGLPYDVTARCSHHGFEKEAIRAVSRTEFLPEIRQGVPVESHNYVYPMEFKLH